MTLRQKVRALARVFSRASYRPVPDLVRLLAKRPFLLAAVMTYEGALASSNIVDERLKALGGLKTSALVGCPF